MRESEKILKRGEKKLCDGEIRNEARISKTGAE